MTTEHKKYVVSGEAYWYTPGVTDKFEEDKYVVTVCNLSDETVELLESLNLTVKDGKEEENEKKHAQNLYVRWKSNYPIKTVDADKNPWPADVKIGNGSKVNVVFFPNEWKYKAKSGWRAIPTTIQVVEHVPYIEAAGGNDMDILDSTPSVASQVKKKAKARVVDEDLNDDLSDILPD